MGDVRLMLGDCLELMPTIPSGTVDAVICDPPYPHIKRDYGYWTEAEWFALMKPLVGECRRVLKPKGSAVFVLQPNSERLGQMRMWLWEFVLWAGKEWGLVQDAYWWNNCSFPEAHSIQGKLLRPSVKMCVWLGEPDCYRDQDAILIPSDPQRDRRYDRERNTRKVSPSGQAKTAKRIYDASVNRGGSSPFNCFPIGNGGPPELLARQKHPAATPLALCEKWVKYLVPPNGTILDPFAGSGTTGIAAIKHGHDYIGIEAKEEYVEIARKRIAEALDSCPLFACQREE